MQVLEQLPDGLAIAVLSASAEDLHHQLSVLPESLYPLAIDAAFPAIRREHCLSLRFAPAFWSDPIMACAALHAVTKDFSPLKRVELGSIPVQNERLLQLVPAACRSALDVSLEYGRLFEGQVPESQHFEQLGEALSHNTALTRLELKIHGQAYQGFDLEGLTDSLTGLQSLTLNVGWYNGVQMPIPIARNIGNLPQLTYLKLGHGFNLSNLPQVLLELPRLQELHVFCEKQQQLPPLATLTVLQTLELQMYGNDQIQQMPSFGTLAALRSLELRGFDQVQQLPSVDTLTALRSLELVGFEQVQQLPSLAALTTLQTLTLRGLRQIRYLPPLETLTALQTLELWHLGSLEQLPSLVSQTALEAVTLHGCRSLLQLPSLDTLAALRTLDLHRCTKLQQLPRLLSLTSLEVMSLEHCKGLQQLPSLDTLTALEMLCLQDCGQLQGMPSLASLTALRRLDVRHCMQLQQLPHLATLTALQTLYLDDCGELQQLPPLSTLTSLQLLCIRSCVKLQTLPPLEALSMLQRLDLQGCERLRRGCLRLPSTQSCKVYGVSAERLQDLQAEHVVEPAL
jgi:Leucine-rich repeat (LRR) protein